MKILYVHRAMGHFGYHRSVIRSLCQKGHSVYALFDKEWSSDRVNPAVEDFAQEHDRFQFGWSLRRRDSWRRPLFTVREILNYARYLSDDEQSVYYRNRWKIYLPKLTKLGLRLPLATRLLAGSTVQAGLRSVERVAPADSRIEAWLRKYRPDVVAVIPMNMRWTEEVEYVKAARKLGMPTVVGVYSWDNLTTKGLYQVVPDLVLAWNSTHEREAMKYHRVPKRRIAITGSPFFDPWFEGGAPTRDVHTLRRLAGISPEQPYLVYLGSSWNITKNEAWLVQSLAESLSASSDERLRSISILVRAHPGNMEGYESLTHPKVTVWPKQVKFPDTPDHFSVMADTLHHAVCTMGVNTSAMIDAIIAGKPCISIMPEKYVRTQKEALHFGQLLRAKVLEVAPSAKASLPLIAAKLDGEDPLRGNRESFIREFIRPRGLGHSAGSHVAKAIELLGRGLRPDRIAERLDGSL